jgi:hypothetical protein
MTHVIAALGRALGPARSRHDRRSPTDRRDRPILQHSRFEAKVERNYSALLQTRSVQPPASALRPTRNELVGIDR